MHSTLKQSYHPYKVIIWELQCTTAKEKTTEDGETVFLSSYLAAER